MSLLFCVVETSAYTVGDGYTPGTIMANGERVHVGAVAYNDVPLGTEIYIGDRRYVVKDRCAYDGVVDIYMPTVQECIEYGRRMEVIMIGCENNANAGTRETDSCGEQRNV